MKSESKRPKPSTSQYHVVPTPTTSTRSTRPMALRRLGIRRPTTSDRSAKALPLVLHVVHQQVLPKPVRRGVEDTPAVDLGQLVHKLLQVVVAIQHECTNGDALLLSLIHISEPTRPY